MRRSIPAAHPGPGEKAPGLGTLAVALGFALVAGPAFGQDRAPGAQPEQRIAVLGLDAGEGLDAVASSVTRSVRRVASVRRGWRLVAEGGLSVAEAKLTYACLDEDPACWAQVGGALNVDLLVAGSVTEGRPLEGEGPGLEITLLLYDVHEVKLIGRLEKLLSRDRLDRSVASAARLLLQPASKPAPPEGVAGAQSPPPAASYALPLTAAPPPVAAPTSPPPQPSTASTGSAGPSSRRFLGWGILGAGATLGGVGLLFGLLAQDAAREYELDETPERRAHELKDQGERYAAGANALYGVGAALAVTGAVLLIATPAEESAETAGSATVVPRLRPAAGPGAAGFAVAGSF